MATYTRKQYLDKEVSHSEYYGQFTTEYYQVFIYNAMTKHGKVSLEDLDHGRDNLKKWDKIPPILGLGCLLRSVGDYPTLAGLNCVNKEAARLGEILVNNRK